MDLCSIPAWYTVVIGRPRISSPLADTWAVHGIPTEGSHKHSCELHSLVLSSEPETFLFSALCAHVQQDMVSWQFCQGFESCLERAEAKPTNDLESTSKPILKTAPRCSKQWPNLQKQRVEPVIGSIVLANLEVKEDLLTSYLLSGA